MALFAFKLKADILLYAITKEIIYKMQMQKWEEYLDLNLISLTHPYIILNIKESINKIHENNKFYFSILTNSEIDFVNLTIISQNNYYIDLEKINNFVKKNIFENIKC